MISMKRDSGDIADTFAFVLEAGGCSVGDA